MATLNSVEFDIIKITTTVIHDNNIMDIPGSDTVVQEDLGYSTAPMRITGHVKNESEYDDFKEQYYSGGELTLIINPDSGKQYTVYALQNLTDLDGNMTYPLSDLVFQAMFFMKNPYLESITDKTRIKSITSNNQEWNADNDGNPLKTDGNVDAVPDIQVTGNVSTVYQTARIGEPISEPSFETIALWTYNENDPQNTLTGVQDSTYYTDGSKSYTMGRRTNQDGTYTYAGEYCEMTQSIDLTGIERISFDVRIMQATQAQFVWSAKVLIDTTEEYSRQIGYEGGDTGWISASIDVSDYDGIHTLKLRSICDQQHNNTWTNTVLYDNLVSEIKAPTKSPEIYNLIDTTIKCLIGNDILDGAIHRINVDGTGTIDFDDDFSTDKWIHTLTDALNITHDTINDELDIADDGYIYWKKDTKLPIDGIPTLTSRINITAGTPTIQISTDASTWYDIDTAIVDDVETIYPLDSDGNLSLAGKTIFYFRIDCVKAVAATCSIKYFELDINIHTIYAKNPKITKGATASTFRCDQDAASGMACDVELIFPDRWWA